MGKTAKTVLLDLLARWVQGARRERVVQKALKESEANADRAARKAKRAQLVQQVRKARLAPREKRDRKVSKVRRARREKQGHREKRDHRDHRVSGVRLEPTSRRSLSINGNQLTPIA